MMSTINAGIQTISLAGGQVTHSTVYLLSAVKAAIIVVKIVVDDSVMTLSLDSCSVGHDE
jgi:hypothetical protein